MMKRNGFIIRILSVTLSLILVLAMIAGCGKKEEEPAQQAEPEASAPQSTSVSKEEASEESGKNDEETAEADTKNETGSASIKDLAGEWEMVYTLFHSEYGTETETYDSCVMSDDPYASTSRMIIREDGGKMKADYLYQGYESKTKYLGVELLEKKEAAYDGCENKDWCFEFSDPFDEDKDNTRYTLLEDGKLIGVSVDSDGVKGTDDYYYYLSTDVYMRKDAPEMKNREDLRYFETVTVSTLEDLINNIDPNKKVILKSGTYDFTKLDKRYIDNEHKIHILGQDEVENGYRTYTLSGFSNFCIEAEKPGEVLICTQEAYDPVMFFTGASNLTLRGLTCGHEVEPGYCSGSVVGFENSSGITVDDCRLYGCGTYGLELHGCDHINVKDSDIYECTYGLLDIYDSSETTFENCTFRDSSDMSMICVQSGYSIVFKNCSFKNNRINPDFSNCCFVDLSENSEVGFENCTFENNQYSLFSNRKVTQKNCTINDNTD